MGSPKTIGKASVVAQGELAAFQVDGRRLAVANVDGRYYAVDEMCTHEECSLVQDGILEGTVITCGCHGAQFDVATGEVLAPPAFEPLAVYQIRVSDGDLIVDV